MENINTHFRDKLEKELALVESELKTVGMKNPDNPSDWEAVPPSYTEVLGGDEHEAADRLETYEENAGILKQLEIRYNEIKRALEKIDGDTYGKCEECGNDIEIERLEVNPAAKTCVKHMN